MTATDELRRMLDERGVEWDVLQDDEGDEMTRWLDSTGRYVTALDYGETQYFADFYWGPTPQQAVEATLGRGTCRDLADTPKYVRIEELRDENDKLRELVRELHHELDAATQYDAGGARGVVFEFADRMRDLGIEVDA